MADRPTFFVDRSLGKDDVPDSLRAAGAVVEIHDTHFAQDTDDEVWIEEVSSKGWVILTKDQRIRRRYRELQAVMLSAARVFTMTSGNMPGDEMGRLFVAHLDQMERLAESLPPPFMATISREGMRVVIPDPRSSP